MYDLDLKKDPRAAPLTGLTNAQRVEALYRLIRKDYSDPLGRQGADASEFLELAGRFLIANPAEFTVDALCSLSMPTKKEGREQTCGYESMSKDAFVDFISKDGPRLVGEYKELKWRGLTGCGPVTVASLESLDSCGAKKCAAFENISHHSFALVLVERQPYWVDFTFDQFINYQEILRRRANRSDEPVSYAGVLILPVDRKKLTFDQAGRLESL